MIAEPIFLYCERVAPGFWGEPVSLATSPVFLPVAIWIWRHAEGMVLLRIMAIATFLLFPGAVYLHTYPSILAVALNMVPIVVVLLAYFYAVHRDFLGLSATMAVVCTALILPFAAVSLPLVAILRGAASSAAYAVIPVMLLGYATVLRQDRPGAARGLFIGALIMAASVAARTVDLPLCDAWPYGTHFLWMLGTALLLWHLARVYRGQMLAGPGGGG